MMAEDQETTAPAAPEAETRAESPQRASDPEPTPPADIAPAFDPSTLAGAPFALGKGDPVPDPGTITAWCLHKRAPAWLAAAMLVGRPVNAEYPDAEIEALARETAGLPLGRKGD